MTSYLFSIMLATVPVGLPVSIRLGMVIVSRHLTLMTVLPKAPGNMPTLGAVSVALIDKTGIMTLNKSEVYGVLTAADVEIDADHEDEVKQTEELVCNVSHKNQILDKSYLIATLCNEANGAVEEMQHIDAVTSISYSTIAGKSIDRGLLMWSGQHINVEELIASRHIKMVIPFTHHHMFSVALVSVRDTPGEAVIMAKGAPERVLSMCSHCMIDGSTRVLTREFRIDLQRMIDAEAERGSRVVALAQSDPLDEVIALRDLKEINPSQGPSNLTFVSVVALADPPREGVIVALITGDSLASATSVAKREGIYADNAHPVHTLN
eukprot:gene37239-45950_t